MHVAYIATTLVAALSVGYAAALNFVGADLVRVAAARVQVSTAWMVPFGALLAAGAAGLLVGLAVPALGTAAAAGLVLYFVCALLAHLRVRDRHVGGAAFFLLLSAAALAMNVAHRSLW